jgi:DNA-binding transcriptional LysR family regulator
MRINPLPPLHSLIAFESAIRLGSFTRAGAELCLTQSAVSRQISQLEDFLGKRLFVREKGTVTATPSGEQYGRQVASLLAGVSEATADTMKYKGEEELTIACSTGIALLWLTPRISAFKREHPGIRIRISVVDSLMALTPAECDIGIYYARRDIPHAFNAQTLFDEEVFPVCSPAYFGGKTVPPTALCGACLLIHEDVQRQWMSWYDWLAAFELELGNVKDTITSNQYVHLVQLAIYGGGVVLAWKNVSDSLIDNGVLVRATDESYSFGGAYYLLDPKERRQNRAARLFTTWLRDNITSFRATFEPLKRPAVIPV